MMLKISNGDTIDSELLCNYFGTLVNLIFKILPMKENKEKTLQIYIKSLQKEMTGCKELVEFMRNDGLYLSLLSILQYQIDNPDCSPNDTRREVFKAISICNKLKSRYSEEVI